MYGLPNDHPLSLAAQELLTEHFHVSDVGAGLEDPLLQLLEEAVASSTAGAPGSGTGTGSPVNVAALGLRDEIADVVNRHWPYRGMLDFKESPLDARLTMWVNSVAPDDQDHLLEMCNYWIYRIRELLVPSRHVVLRHESCPGCKCVYFPQQDEDGGTVRQHPLVAHLSETPLRIECRSCGAQWSGEMEIGLYFSRPLG